MRNDKYQQFDMDQRMEIEEGLADGLDVNIYAKKEFMAIHMHQIRLGLKDGLDVTVYADPKYDWFQMEEIRLGLKSGIDYTKYALPTLEYTKMRQIRLGLEQGIDLSGFTRLNAGILGELRQAMYDRVDITEYINEGYNVEQLEQIRYALVNQLDIREFLSKEFLGASIREICKGLEKGLDPSIYATIDYGWQQMREIRFGMENRVDVDQYSNSLFSWQQMREIRLGLEDGLDVSSYRRFIYTAADMEKKRKLLLLGKTEDTAERKAEVVEHAKLFVFISSDEMEASIQITCDKSEDITTEEIMNTLKSEGITHGIKEKEIERLVHKKQYQQLTVIARGKYSERGKDGWYEFFFNTKPDRSPKIAEDGSAEYQDIDWFEPVLSGQKIAYYHEAEEGEAGYTVTGKPLPVIKGREQSILTGKGYMLMPDKRTYVSAMNGKIELIDDNRILISKLLFLDDVTTSTGNINFEGSVYIKGNVGSGVEILATEDIIINGFVESATIKSGGEILIKKGANGAGHGLIQAEKRVTSKFYESIEVVSGGDIYANYALNSNLTADGLIVVTGSKGIIAGGRLAAIKGLRAYNIGNSTGIKTMIKIGADESIMQDKQSVERQILDTNQKLAILGNSYIDFQRKYPPEVRNLMDNYLKIENAIYTEEMHLDELYKKQSKIEDTIKSVADARIVVDGDLHEGTSITIGNTTWKAIKTRNITIRYTNGKITAYSN